MDKAYQTMTQRLWPAVWLMGNLARAGYGGTSEGVWPYSYDSCDIGALPNQTLNGESILGIYQRWSAELTGFKR